MSDRKGEFYLDDGTRRDLPSLPIRFPTSSFDEVDLRALNTVEALTPILSAIARLDFSGWAFTATAARVHLRDLRRDASLSGVALARRVGLSACACWRRVQRLQASGTILGYHAVIDETRPGPEAVAFVVGAGSSWPSAPRGRSVEEIRRDLAL